MKTIIELLVKEPDNRIKESLHVTNTEMFMPPREGEHVIFQGDTYIVCEIIHNYDKNKIEIILIDTGVW